MTTPRHTDQEAWSRYDDDYPAIHSTTDGKYRLRVIETDRGYVAQIKRTANSAWARLAPPIQDKDHAIRIITPAHQLTQS